MTAVRLGVTVTSRKPQTAFVRVCGRRREKGRVSEDGLGRDLQSRRTSRIQLCRSIRASRDLGPCDYFQFSHPFSQTCPQIEIRHKLCCKPWSDMKRRLNASRKWMWMDGQGSQRRRCRVASVRQTGGGRKKKFTIVGKAFLIN